MRETDAFVKALTVLKISEEESVSVYESLRRVQDAHAKEDARINAHIEALAIGTVRRIITIDYVLNLYSSVQTAKMKPFIRRLLRLSAWELLFAEDAVPAQVVDHAVTLCKKNGFQGLGGFVNGLLRRIARETNNIEYPSISIRYSVPEWIVHTLTNRYGEAEAERICAHALSPGTLCVRLSTRLSEEEIKQYPKKAEAALSGIRVSSHPLLPFCFLVSGNVYPPSLLGFAEGDLFVQDAGSVLCALACGETKGKTVFDVCAAPGGKALFLAEKADNVYAFDISREKCARIEENKARMHADNLLIRVRDARDTDPSLQGQADIVLCDLPCSGLGVMAKKADIRYRVKPEDIISLQALQRGILTASVSCLKAGGILLYSTCTLTREENEENRDFIIQTLGLHPDPLTPFLPEALQTEETVRDGYLTLLPGKYDTDGFFIARFQKKEGTA